MGKFNLFLLNKLAVNIVFKLINFTIFHGLEFSYLCIVLDNDATRAYFKVDITEWWVQIGWDALCSPAIEDRLILYPGLLINSLTFNDNGAKYRIFIKRSQDFAQDLSGELKVKLES